MSLQKDLAAILSREEKTKVLDSIKENPAAKGMNAAQRKAKQRAGYRAKGLVFKESWIHPDRAEEYTKMVLKMQEPNQ